MVIIPCIFLLSNLDCGLCSKLIVSTHCYWPCFRIPRVGPETNCTVECSFLNDARPVMQQRADAIVGFIPQTRRLRPGQILFAYWQESSANVHVTRNGAVMRQFNYSYSYRQDRELWRESGKLSEMMASVYAHLRTGDLPPPVPYEEKCLRPVVSTVISNTALTPNRRGDVLHKLVRTPGISVSHYGHYLRNAQFPPDNANPALLRYKQWNTPRVGGPNDFQKVKAIAQHLFHFAFENSDCPWYHTEKAFQPLAAGTIPVYLGAHTIRDVMPNNSFLYVKDYATPRDLVDHMFLIAANQTLYESYFEWRNKPPPPHLQTFIVRHTPQYHAQLLCKMCKLVHDQTVQHHLAAETCEKPYWT